MSRVLVTWLKVIWVGGSRSKERDQKSELVLRSTYQIFWMGSKQLGSKFLLRSQICSHTPNALNAGAKRSAATCYLAMPQCCYLAKGAKRPSHTTNAIKFVRNPFDLCNSIKRFDLCPFDQKKSTYLQSPKSFDLKPLSWKHVADFVEFIVIT